MKTGQQDLFKTLATTSEKREYKRRVIHGGKSSKGKRKTRRPLATKKWVHLVLKSSKARGYYSMLSQKNSPYVEKLIQDKAKKFGVQVKQFVNMGNHLHFQIRIHTRENFQNFLRSITSLIARFVTGAKRGNAVGKFWDGLAFTRVITTGFELTQLAHYLYANKQEKRTGYASRERYLKSVNRWMSTLRKTAEGRVKLN